MGSTKLNAMASAALIETDEKTESDLREAVRFATSYAADSFGVDTREKLDKIPREQFAARCYEGFDLAQKSY
jgi:hypothetical protein